MTYPAGSVTVPFPAFSSVEDAQAWAEMVFGFLIENQRRNNAILAEARKVLGAALTADAGFSANSGDADTDTQIDTLTTRVTEIEAILVANNLATEA